MCGKKSFSTRHQTKTKKQSDSFPCIPESLEEELLKVIVKNRTKHDKKFSSQNREEF